MAIKKRLLEGTVVSDKMNKVAVVRVDTFVFHPLYKKRMSRSKKYLVHDESNQCRMDDRVAFSPSRPFSKRTRHTLDRIISSKASETEVKSGSAVQGGTTS